MNTRVSTFSIRSRTRRRVLLVALTGGLSACSFDYAVGTTPPDGSVDAFATFDAPSDAISIDTSVILPDGNVCSGHDEDGDGLPDDCDFCPAVPDTSLDTAVCPPDPALIPAPSRLLFASFATAPIDWEFGLFPHASTTDGGVSDAPSTSDANAPDSTLDSAVDSAHDTPDTRRTDGAPDSVARDSTPPKRDATTDSKASEAAVDLGAATPDTLLDSLLPDDSAMDSWLAEVGPKSGTFHWALEGEALTGGDPSSDGFFTAIAPLAPSDKALSVTAVVRIEAENPVHGGTTGILVRLAGNGSYDAYLCVVSLRGSFAAARTPDGGCTEDHCAPVNMTRANSGPAVAAIPAEFPLAAGQPIGLRATLGRRDPAASGAAPFECRVFDPATPATLRTGGDAYAVRVVPTVSWGAGRVGVYAQSALVRVTSFEVVGDP